MAARIETGKKYAPDQLDRQFRALQQGLNNLLSGDVTVTGQWTFDVGRSQTDGGGPNNPINYLGFYDNTTGSDNLDIITLDIDLDGTPLAGSFLRFGEVALTGGASLPGLIIGGTKFGSGGTSPVLSFQSNNSQGTIFNSDLVFSSALRGVRYANQTGLAVVLPGEPRQAVIRYDLYSPAQMEFPPGLANDQIAVTMIHPEARQNDNDFAFQLAYGTLDNVTVKDKEDPRIRIRTGNPDLPAPDGEWNGDWGAIPVVFNLEEFTDDPAWQGGLLMFDLDVSYPDGGRTIPFKQQAAALYIDYTDTIKPGPFLPGNAINFTGGFGYNTPDAAFSVALGTLTIPAGNPGAYSLNATFTLDIGTGATAILGVHDNGVAAQGLASAASTGNQSSVVALNISGIFPVDDTAHTIDIRVMPSSNTVLVVESGQFWIKREFS